MGEGAAKAYGVIAYSIEELERIITHVARADADVVRGKLHMAYFEEYFRALAASTIVIEREYVDRDYLEDYAAYYVRCFPGYARFCTRLHFFRARFTESDLDALLRGDVAAVSERELQASYLGFIVVKPLPETVVGRTCLVTYPDDADRRRFPILQDAEASLFGIALVARSLPFQEQDHAVAACATSALWSVFHGTGRLFHHPIPSPVEITNAAMDQRPLERFTNFGLNPTQMARAIRRVGLEPAPSRVVDVHWLRNVTYAYLRGGVPLLLAVTLNDIIADPTEELGGHALAVAGYSLGGAITTDPKTRLRTVASRIDKLYAHDDQVGPFARMEIDLSVGQRVRLDGIEEPVTVSLTTSWHRGNVRAFPDYVLVPLYHKIRIPFEVIHDEVMGFNELAGLIVASPIGSALALHASELTWDIYLQTANDAKRDIRGEGLLRGDDLAVLVTCPLPRYLWHVRAVDGDTPALDVLVDATDIRQGKLVIWVHAYNRGFIAAAKAFAATIPAAHMPQAKKTSGWRILASLLR